jgi:hypothetical protein
VLEPDVSRFLKGSQSTQDVAERESIASSPHLRDRICDSDPPPDRDGLRGTDRDAFRDIDYVSHVHSPEQQASLRKHYCSGSILGLSSLRHGRIGARGVYALKGPLEEDSPRYAPYDDTVSHATFGSP